MVAHLGLRTHELLYEEIGTIIAETLSSFEKAESHTNHPQRIFTLIHIKHIEKSNFPNFKERWEWLLISIGRFPILLLEFLNRPIFGAHCEMSNHLR